MSPGPQAVRPASTTAATVGAALLLIWGTASSWAYPLLSTVRSAVKVLHMQSPFIWEDGSLSVAGSICLGRLPSYKLGPNLG